MAYILVIAWFFTVIAAFRNFPFDEACVRTAILSVVYVLAYLLIRGLYLLVLRIMRIGKN